MNIKIICVGKLRERYHIDESNEYVKRLSAFCSAEIVEIAEQRLPSDPSENDIALALRKESLAIIDKIPAGATVVALCVEGDGIDSESLSKFLETEALRGISRFCFIIGGSYGLGADIKKLAHFKLSLSKMTFPHALARIILLEQLYRAFKIAEGSKYHK
ncbi:MAG: 23S rRNA (pseudouridine(1915)-N(3))-methyltransferase RlmH [Oscillospiraceae bacterium]|nr:23S rRNA (pseudouridine(1915)-N(3))-methyltransferase RlmH [Oscillospiraceae bacterium]